MRGDRAGVAGVLPAVLAGWVAVLVLLGGVALHQQGVRAFVVSSGSMAPAIPVGSLVLTAPVVDPQPGTVITFRQGGGTVTHRVVAVEGDRLVTRGDANTTPDAGSVRTGSLMGRVGLTVPLAGYAVVFLRQPATLPALVLLVVLVGAGSGAVRTASRREGVRWGRSTA